jgi:hypothetical protein
MFFKVRVAVFGIFCAWLAGSCGVALTAQETGTQDAKAMVRQAVQTELAADKNDHSRWLYFEEDKRPKHNVTQWVADTGQGSVHRVLAKDGRKLSPAEQKSEMDGFVKSPGEQAKLRKSGQHDDEQATELLKLLPDAFTWTDAGKKNGDRVLHFKPDMNFHPPNREAKVFAAMEGDMAVDAGQHRIVSLKGRLVRDVKFGGGLFATLKAGGTFDVERRETAAGIWQITETHVHIDGHALLFKSIAEQEDDVKSKLRQLPGDISLEQAEQELLKQTE